MDIDYDIRKGESCEITDKSTLIAFALYEWWERSNRLSVIFIKTKIKIRICGFVDQSENVRYLLKFIDKQSVTSKMALAKQLNYEFFFLPTHRCEKCVRAYNESS